MILRQIYHRPLAQASYLIGCAATGDALVIDPNREIEQYLQLAEQEGVRITAVTETHIHADFVSGARELAARTGATLYLSAEGGEGWQYAWAPEAGAVLVRDGDSFMVGNIRIDVVHTPGHTPEHISFLVTDTAGADRPMGIATGDFVFVGDVGRPDLLERAAGYAGTMEAGARRLFQSLQRFKQLPGYVQVWPGHGAGSACGKALGAVPQTTVGYESLFSWALQIEDEERFVQAVLEGQPEPPRYFAEMKRMNRDGARLTSELPALRRLPDEALASALAEGMPVVDTRPSDIALSGFVPGTLHIPAGGSFLTWAGWLLPYDRPFALIADADTAEALARELRLIGLDDLAGYWTPDAVATWAARNGGLASVTRLDVPSFRRFVETRPATVLDVRNAAEVASGLLPDARHIQLGTLPQRLAELPDGPVAVYCQSGGRSPIAASLLANGRREVVELRDGMNGWRAAELPVQPAHELAPAR